MGTVQLQRCRGYSRAAVQKCGSPGLKAGKLALLYVQCSVHLQANTSANGCAQRNAHEGKKLVHLPISTCCPLARGALMPITEVQALTSAVQRTHSSRLALAALMPILARRAAAGCAQSGASYWHGLGCSLANMPLVYLLLMHVLLIAAAAAPLLATGESMMAQVWNC